jgi:transposase
MAKKKKSSLPKKRNPAVKRAPSEDYFVSLVDPLSTRRKLLEASKQAVRLLQMHVNMVELKRQRSETITELSRTLNELSRIVSVARKIVPELQEGEMLKNSDAREMISRIAKSSSEKKQEKKIDEEVEKSGKELDALEKELAEIEEKLGKL